ncbi:MAG: hypothetical protein LIQ30_04050 [Planctomycetes bacterium]|nr:hypothetical protein [Planctomycetota bacterium]
MGGITIGSATYVPAGPDEYTGVTRTPPLTGTAGAVCPARLDGSSQAAVPSSSENRGDDASVGVTG